MLLLGRNGWQRCPHWLIITKQHFVQHELAERLDQSCLLFEYKEFVLLLQRADLGHILLQHGFVVVFQNDRPNASEQVNCMIDHATNLDSRFHVDKRLHLLNKIKSGGGLDPATCEGDKNDFLSTCLERTRWFVGKGMEGFLVKEGIDSGLNLRITSCEGTAERTPIAIATMSTAIHFNEAWSFCRHHNFAVRGAILDTESIEYASYVGNKNLGLSGVGINRNTTKVHKGGAVGRAFVIDPNHDSLVDSIP
mmetsp:Transcript_34636/g.51438  ORF Transcript_34636/g.51438 Transcript_34636/m.51438 type:complete len:251 (-) Transcript_34636:716-1468(-)